MLNQKQYDAIVVFSDFEDGVIQWRTIGEVKPSIVFDADLRPPTDLRTEAEKAWEARWIRTFATAQDRKAPRLYLYLDLAGAAGNLPTLRLGFRRRFQDRHDGEGRDFRRASAEVVR